MGDEYNFNYKDTRYEELVDCATSYFGDAQDLVKFSRSVDRFGNRLSNEGYRVIMGILPPEGKAMTDLFKYYSTTNSISGENIEMLARLILAVAEDVKEIRELDAPPIKELLAEIAEKAEELR